MHCLPPASDDRPLPAIRRTEQDCHCGDELMEMESGGCWVALPCVQCQKHANDAVWIAETLAANAAMTAALYHDKTLDSFVADEPFRRDALNLAREWMAQARRGKSSAIVMLSWDDGEHTGFGTGKTHLASGIAHELATQGWRMSAWSVPELFSRIRSSFDDAEGGTEWQMVRDVLAADLLVLDDLGQERFKDAAWHTEVLYRLINGRYMRGPLVITGNVNPEGLGMWIGGAALSRLMEMTRQSYFVARVQGPDYRLSKRVQGGHDGQEITGQK